MAKNFSKLARTESSSSSEQIFLRTMLRWAPH
jgi:hypothetical protein